MTTTPTPAYVHHLLDAFLTGQPLNFHHDPVPLDVQRRLERAVATGQMGTVPKPADAAPSTHHVIAFDADGTWHMEHPTTCPSVDAPILCHVRELAEQQMAGPDLRASMAGLSFRCAVNDIGDRFLLGDQVEG